MWYVSRLSKTTLETGRLTSTFQLHIRPFSPLEALMWTVWHRLHIDSLTSDNLSENRDIRSTMESNQTSWPNVWNVKSEGTDHDDQRKVSASVQTGAEPSSLCLLASVIACSSWEPYTPSAPSPYSTMCRTPTPTVLRHSSHISCTSSLQSHKSETHDYAGILQKVNRMIEIFEKEVTKSHSVGLWYHFSSYCIWRTWHHRKLSDFSLKSERLKRNLPTHKHDKVTFKRLWTRSVN